MVTPELISYIKGEFAKGKKREDIRAVLVSEGGWSEADLNEAFRTVMPMQNLGVNPTQSISPVQNTQPAQPVQPIQPIQTAKPIQINPMQNNSVNNAIQDSMLHNATTAKIQHSSMGKLLFVLFIILVALGAGATWYFRPILLTNTWNDVKSKVAQIEMPSLSSKVEENPVIVPPEVPAVVAEIPETVKNCGIGVSPDLKKSSTYEKNSVLECLGQSALVCENAEAIVTDALLPNLYQITKDKNTNTCNFKLSYTEDSTLIDPTGKPSALQYVTCPISVVKAVDESKKPTAFNAPAFDNPAKYASQIYFYGTLGVFIEGGIDANKIQALGCSGPYVDSLIAGYKQTQ